MPRTDYEERKAARIDRLRERAAKANQEAASRFANATKLVNMIPMGQPILIGHHSEKGHRAHLAKIDKNMEIGCLARTKAKRLAEQAEAAESNDAISSDDPEAVRKLTEKISQAETLQEAMKATNKILRKKGLSADEKISAIAALGFSAAAAERAVKPHNSWQETGFPHYKLSNNNANIRRMKQRLATLKAAPAETVEQEIGGLRVVENAETNRIQIIFPDKPSEPIREILKYHGFRWARSEGAWQRHLNNAGRWAAQAAVEKITALN